MPIKTEYTAPGYAAWVKVYEPDYEYKEGGEFQVDLFLEESDAKPIIKLYEQTIKDKLKEKDGKGKLSPDVMYSLVSEMKQEHIDKLAARGYTPDPKMYRFKFRNGFEIKPKGGTPFTNTIKVLDKDNHKRAHNPEEEIGNGAKVRVAYPPYGWAVSGKIGCKLRLVGLQVLENPQPYSKEGVAIVFDEPDIAF